ncbi:hypothetical protein [Streptomyces zaomyceticus]|uniref:hypothetical protein n=1 Tax=Streptomyces zaomyceticus TaxID=68286 RepID=UPI003439054F
MPELRPEGESGARDGEHDTGDAGDPVGLAEVHEGDDEESEDADRRYADAAPEEGPTPGPGCHERVMGQSVAGRERFPSGPTGTPRPWAAGGRAARSVSS